MTAPWNTPVGEMLASLRDERHFSFLDAELLLEHLCLERSPDFWNENATAQIRNNAGQRRDCSDHRNRAYVSEQVALLAPSEFPLRQRLAERWLVGPLARFERAVRSTYADRRVTLQESRLAYLRSVFVLCLMSANAPSGQPSRRTAFFPVLPGRSRPT